MRGGLLVAIIAVVVAGCGRIAEPVTSDFSGMTVSHPYRLVFRLPAGWTMQPGTLDTYSDGMHFVRLSSVLLGDSLEKVCLSAADDARTRGETHAYLFTTSQNYRVCSITTEGADAQTFIAYPKPLVSQLGRGTYAFVRLESDDAALLEGIIESVRFPDSVPPTLYAAGLLDLMEANALYREKVDWGALRAEPVTTFSDARRVLNLALLRLQAAGDYHTHVQPPLQANLEREGRSYDTGYYMLDGIAVLVYPGSPASRAGLREGDIISEAGVQPTSGLVSLDVQREPDDVALEFFMEPYDGYLSPRGELLDGGIGYIELRGLKAVGDSYPRYARFTQYLIRLFDLAGQPCGWIVDLRRNLGGGVLPMLTGLGALLGDGMYYGELDSVGDLRMRRYEDGVIRGEDLYELPDLVTSPYLIQNPDAPIAVLTSTLTASAGELSVVAFLNRPRTRIFGQHTRGLTTFNTGIQLYDGSVLYLSYAWMTDGQGKVQERGIEPDEVMSTDFRVFGTDADSVLQAAREWLSRQPECQP